MKTPVPAPIIVSALFGRQDFLWLNAQRQAHFPPERNVLDAHLTLFHHLPPSCVDELCERLRMACCGPAPPAELSGLIALGRGVAYRVRADALAKIRDDLAQAFSPLLVPQDKAGWRPHVTIQNKVTPSQARALLDDLQRTFRPRTLAITGLAAWWYRDGPWELLSAYRFGSGTRVTSSSLHR